MHTWRAALRRAPRCYPQHSLARRIYRTAGTNSNGPQTNQLQFASLTTESGSRSISEVSAPQWKPPRYCPGCGAPSQRLDAKLPGYYALKPTARRQKQYGPGSSPSTGRRVDEIVWNETLKRVGNDPIILRKLGSGENDDPNALVSQRNFQENRESGVPLCERCHSVTNHHQAPPLPSYPTLDTLSSLLLASPHRYNHIYHLIDAVDFPLSLFPELRRHLYKTLPSNITHYLTVSFVITRCDVLLPEREEVVRLLNYFKSVLKESLPEGEGVEGPPYSNTRLYLVSASHGWGLRDLKREIANRQGGVWFFGAVNVGKSRLLREVWPMDGETRATSAEDAMGFGVTPDSSQSAEEQMISKILDEAQNATAEPSRSQVPPVVSDLPGTTAAPIRVSYKTAGRRGKIKAELVDLPGFERWVGIGNTGVMKYVREDCRSQLIMRERQKSQQYTIKRGQSMIIGGLYMIVPGFLAEALIVNPFVTLPIHITSTSKALAYLNHPKPAASLPDIAVKGDRPKLFQDPDTVGIRDLSLNERNVYDSESPKRSPGSSISLEKARAAIPLSYKSAGRFGLTDDITMERNPKLRKSERKLKKLAYTIYGTDILLEGIGWLELCVQMRNKYTLDEEKLPFEVEIFSPEGKGVGQRRVSGIFMRLKSTDHQRGNLKKGTRPRPSRKGHRKMMKRLEKQRALGNKNTPSPRVERATDRLRIK